MPTGLAHYTSSEGLLGILSSNKIRASHIFFLNDHSEHRLVFETTLELIERGVLPLMTWVAQAPDLVAQLKEQLSPYVRGRFPSVFIVSLTERWNDLSQWRGYTQPGNGYSLVFKMDALHERAKQHGWRLEKCIYLEDLYAIILPMIEDVFLKYVQAKYPSAESAAADLKSRLTPLVPLVKHQAFHAESEWRLVSPPLDEWGTPFKYRPGPSYIVPYVDFELGKELASYLMHVTIGPGPNDGLAGDAVGLFIVQHGNPCGYGRSEIPYRPW